MKLLVSLVSFFLVASSLSAMDLSRLPEPYKSVRLLPFNPHGWHGNGIFLEKLINENQVQIVVEIGSWMGLSTRDIARLLPERGIIYAVDTWKGAPEECEDPSILAPAEVMSTLYDQFLSNVIHTNLTHKIVPVKMESRKAAECCSIYPDLVYIDGSHTYKAVLQDLKAWWPLIKGHGILCGDDYYNAPGVKQAVTEFALGNNLQVNVEGNFWRLEE